MIQQAENMTEDLHMIRGEVTIVGARDITMTQGTIAEQMNRGITVVGIIRGITENGHLTAKITVNPKLKNEHEQLLCMTFIRLVPHTCHTLHDIL